MPDFTEMRNALNRATNRHGIYSTYTAGCRCDPCRRANTDYHIALKHRHRTNQQPIKQRIPNTCDKGNLPIDPLLNLFNDIDTLDDTDIAIRCGYTNRSTIRKWRRHGLNLVTADKVAIHLGKHPYEIWGGAYFKAK